MLINLPKRDSGKPSNVVIRGVTADGLALRPQVKLVEGRMFRPGHLRDHRRPLDRRRLPGAGLGETLRFASRDWTVVGVFDAGRTGFDSEIWGDAEQMLQAFRRLGFSSLIFRLADADRFDAVKARSRADPRLTLEAKRETRFYADQSEALSKFISYLGTTISVIFSIGAIIGAMITMYASVASRTGEIGTLRALGFSRARDPRRVPRRGAAARARSAASSASSRASFMQALVDLDDQFPDVRRARVLVHADAGHRRRVAGRSRWRWASSAASCRRRARRG